MERANGTAQNLYKGVVGLVFGNSEQTFQDNDGGVGKLLERIKDGVLAEDRRRAMDELQDVVAESRSAQLAFGATGLTIMLSVLKEERGDIDLVRGALETLVNALGPEGTSYATRGQVQPGVLNSELLAREDGSASVLLSLLDEDDFYVRYHTLCLLTMLSRNSSVRLQEAVLATPQGLVRLMDMLQDREVIRNEALLLLTFLTRSAEEIQKIAVFEGVFEKLFNIIVEEGGSDGGIVVQDCLDLLNNILRGSQANQSFLRETIGLQPVASLLRIRKSSSLNLSQQKTINLLCILETLTLLLARDVAKEIAKDTNCITNQTVLMQNNVLDYLLNLSVEGKVAAVAVRCASLRCLGDLIRGHSTNSEILSKRIVGGEPDGESALCTLLNLTLNTSDKSEWAAAEYVLKCFCEGNSEGQLMLAATMTPSFDSQSNGNKLLGASGHSSFGSMLIHALRSTNSNDNFQLSCRAGRVLIHILEDNLTCKETVLDTGSEISASSPLASENFMSRCVKCLAEVVVQPPEESKSHWRGRLCLQAVLLRLLVTWLANCPNAVTNFLRPAGQLAVVVELLTIDGSSFQSHVRGLAAVLLGESILYNLCADGRKGASMVVDIISQRVGLASYFEKWEDLQKDPIYLAAAVKSGVLKPSIQMSIEENDSDGTIGAGNVDETSESEVQSMLVDLYNAEFVKQCQNLLPLVKDRIFQLFNQSKDELAIPAVIQRNQREADDAYIGRLQTLLEKQNTELQELSSRNAALAEELMNRTGSKDLQRDRSELVGDSRGAFGSRLELESLKKQVQAYQREIESMKKEKLEKEQEVSYYMHLAEKHEGDLKSLSAAYNSLEQENYKWDLEIQNLKKGIQAPDGSELEAAREEGRQEAVRENEAELNDLLVCLGQEESKVERLRGRLEELGEDVEELLQGIGEEADQGTEEE